MKDRSSKKANKSKAWSFALGTGLGAIALLLALGSYHAQDPSFNTLSEAWSAPKNVLGYVGSWSSDALFQLFGFSAWLLPAILLVALVRWLSGAERENERVIGTRGWAALALALAAGTLFFDLIAERLESLGSGDFPPMGLLGMAIGAACRPFIGVWGSHLLVWVLVWSFCMVWWERLPGHVYNAMALVARTTWIATRALLAKVFKSKFKAKHADKDDGGPQLGAADEDDDGEKMERDFAPVIKQRAQESPAAPEARKEKAPKEASPVRSTPHNWQLPPLALLKAPKARSKGPSPDELKETGLKIGKALRSFNVEGQITEITPGPIVTMYEFQPAAGVRVREIKNTATDLSMTLGVPSVRILAPIPGKSVVGIEVPNPEKDPVVLREVFEATRDKAARMKLPLVVGKDSEGADVAEDLARMPHLLVGGATNMGKSVLVNSLLSSLLLRFTPDELRLIIVDPKLVEFKAFENIPHLLLPIVNDPEDASKSLRWAVSETKRRYLLMERVGAKNIESFNAKVASGEIKDKDDQPIGRFPYVVIIIDELAELMMGGKKDVEQSIVRLTQLARAAGLHLIMATQRPSADVVTGLIKSNCPSRAALRVASASDSRIILDCSGAEQLLGKGDMIFTNTGPMGQRRMQGCFVSDEEIEKVCEFWSNQGEPEFQEQILAEESEDAAADMDDPANRDTLFDEVLSFAREKGKISTSLIQRRFQIGYTRAARIMEQLESAGIVGEASVAGKPRDVIA